MVELTFLSKGALIAALDICEETGLPAIAQDLENVNGVGNNAPAWTEEKIKAHVAELSKYSCLEGYYIWDEPTDTMFTQTRQLRDTFKKYAPGKLAFSCVFPSYGVYNWDTTEWGWENSRYVQYVDGYLNTVEPEVLSVDYYPFGHNGGNISLQTHDLWRDMGLMRRRSLDRGIPYWHYFQASGDLEGKTVGDMTPEKIAVQMYAGLAYGVKGLSYFATFSAMTEYNPATNRYQKSRLYDAMAAVNTKVKNIGNQLFGTTSTALYHTGLPAATRSAYYADDLAASPLIGSLPAGTVAGVFAGGGKTYLMIVNKDYQNPITGQITLKQSRTVKEFQAAAGTYAAGKTGSAFSVTLGQGEGKLFLLE